MSTTIPTPPTPADPPQRKEGSFAFWNKCDDFVLYLYNLGLYLVDFVTAMTAVIAETLAYRDAAAAAALESQDQAELATSNGAAQVTLATAQADRALSYAELAQVESPPAWAADASYSYPQTAVGSDGNTYRCLGVSVVGVDPTRGTVSWLQLTGVSESSVFEFENCGGF